jgi:Concanavalin A-like lectin/glucanases superfamily
VTINASAGARTYKNGNLTNSDASITSFRNANGDFKIGTKLTGTNFFQGRPDDLRIYNRALSATEIKQLYNAGR